MKKLFTYACCLCSVEVESDQPHDETKLLCCEECRERFLEPYLAYIDRHILSY
jgi:DNA-directed RNA polymerase subunit RPC12/RpoP